MTDMRELLLHELGDILYAERILVKALPELEKEASDDELAEGFKGHLAETKAHVANVEDAFKALGEKAKAEKCPGIEGIKKEHDEFVKKEAPSAEILDAFLTGAGARTEHYEIAAYEGVIASAQAMGEGEVVRLLSENLAQEQKALRSCRRSASASHATARKSCPAPDADRAPRWPSPGRCSWLSRRSTARSRRDRRCGLSGFPTAGRRAVAAGIVLPARKWSNTRGSMYEALLTAGVLPSALCDLLDRRVDRAFPPCRRRRAPPCGRALPLRARSRARCGSPSPRSRRP